MNTPFLEGGVASRSSFGSHQTRGFRRDGGRDGTLHDAEHSLLRSRDSMKSLTELKRQGDGEVVSLQIGSPITAEILSLYVRHCMLRPAKLFFETTPLFYDRIDP